MWPRTEEERLRRRNCGFVSFMKRSSAEDARDDLDGYELDGMKMTVNWVLFFSLNKGYIIAALNTMLS